MPPVVEYAVKQADSTCVDRKKVASIASGSAIGSIWRKEYPYQPGKRIGLSLPRRFVCDLLHFAKKVPSVPMQRRMHLANLVAARKEAGNKIGWCAIFLKAFAIVSASRRELRQAYMSLPWGQLYEHPGTIASVGIERDFQGEKAVFFGKIPAPEELSLAEIEALLQYYKNEPIEQIASFRLGLNLSRLPLPARRLIWWLGLNLRGLIRAGVFGTFGISVVASLGAAGLHLLSPSTVTLNYGVFEANGALDVRLAYDHRVMDGANAARAMADLEEVLNGIIVNELLTEYSESHPF